MDRIEPFGIDADLDDLAVSDDRQHRKGTGVGWGLNQDIVVRRDEHMESLRDQILTSCAYCEPPGVISGSVVHLLLELDESSVEVGPAC